MDDKNVNCAITTRLGPTYAPRMVSIFRTLITSLPLVAIPAVAADVDVETGITGIGLSVFIFSLAAALLLTLLFRASASRLARLLLRRVGQHRIRRQLSTKCQDVLHGPILPGAYGGLAKIDHAALTRNGILCVRAVHFSGKVQGNVDDAQWTHTDSFGTQRFLNPLIQNEGRTRALKKAVPGATFVNLVVFSGNVEFAAKPPPNVIAMRQLGKYLQSLDAASEQSEAGNPKWQELKAAIFQDTATRKDFAAQISFS
ncbi:MAG TPA: nuclease-related domain-containing protein [Woeseiaceae bacterium]|nr:nuclease-related domain-containing protein [Woeseiaceae bacterium]